MIKLLALGSTFLVNYFRFCWEEFVEGGVCLFAEEGLFLLNLTKFDHLEPIALLAAPRGLVLDGHFTFKFYLNRPVVALRIRVLEKGLLGFEGVFRPLWHLLAQIACRVLLSGCSSHSLLSTLRVLSPPETAHTELLPMLLILNLFLVNFPIWSWEVVEKFGDSFGFLVNLNPILLPIISTEIAGYHS